jgi:hypothetical protein
MDDGPTKSIKIFWMHCACMEKTGIRCMDILDRVLVLKQDRMHKNSLKKLAKKAGLNIKTYMRH